MSEETTSYQNNRMTGMTEMAGGEEAEREQMDILLKRKTPEYTNEMSEKPVDELKQEFDFGKFAYLLVFINSTISQIQRTEYYKAQDEPTQDKLMTLIETIRNVHLQICTKLTTRITQCSSDSPEYQEHVKTNCVQGSKALIKKLDKIITDQSLEDFSKEFSTHTVKVVNTTEQITTEQINTVIENDLTGTRICMQFTKGRPCTHHACKFAHSFQTFKPRVCVNDGSCNRLATCECCHTLTNKMTGETVLETPEQIVARIKIVKEFPTNEVEKKIHHSGAHNMKASREEQRQTYKQHSQLLKEQQKQNDFSRIHEPVPPNITSKTAPWKKKSPMQSPMQSPMMATASASVSVPQQISTIQCSAEQAMEMMQMMQEKGISTNCVNFKIM